MPKWNAYAKVSGTKYLGEVEAETEEEAKEKAWNGDEGICLCHQCSDECEDAEIEEVNVDPVDPEPRT